MNYTTKVFQSIYKWMMTEGSPIWGNLQMTCENQSFTNVYPCLPSTSQYFWFVEQVSIMDEGWTPKYMKLFPVNIYN